MRASTCIVFTYGNSGKEACILDCTTANTTYDINQGSCLYMRKADFQLPVLEALREAAGLLVMTIEIAMIATVMNAEIRRVQWYPKLLMQARYTYDQTRPLLTDYLVQKTIDIGFAQLTRHPTLKRQRPWLVPVSSRTIEARLMTCNVSEIVHASAVDDLLEAPDKKIKPPPMPWVIPYEKHPNEICYNGFMYRI